MTAYAFGTGRLEGDDGSKATLHDVSLDFDRGPPLDDDSLKITGTAKRIVPIDGALPESGQIYFETTTSNFGVSKKVIIKLNNCLINGNQFEARADKHGNVFTLTMDEAA